MAKVTGFGGVFFKTPDPQAMAKWFTEVLDLPTDAWGRMFPGAADDYTVLGFHASDSDCFRPGSQPFMFNLRVDDLDGMLALLTGRGVEVIKVFDADAHGRFAHVQGPEGITLELWQPVSQVPQRE